MYYCPYVLDARQIVRNTGFTLLKNRKCVEKFLFNNNNKNK